MSSPIIKSSTAVLLEAAASLEESSPFQVPKKKKKKDKEDREKSKGEEKKKSSKKDKESKGSHSEVSVEWDLFIIFFWGGWGVITFEFDP